MRTDFQRLRSNLCRPRSVMEHSRLLPILDVLVQHNVLLLHPRDIGRLAASCSALGETASSAFERLFKFVATLKLPPRSPHINGEPHTWAGEKGLLSCFADPAPSVIQSCGWGAACKCVFTVKCAHCGNLGGFANPFTMTRTCFECADAEQSMATCDLVLAKHCFMLADEDVLALKVAHVPSSKGGAAALRQQLHQLHKLQELQQLQQQVSALELHKLQRLGQPEQATQAAAGGGAAVVAAAAAAAAAVAAAAVPRVLLCDVMELAFEKWDGADGLTAQLAEGNETTDQLLHRLSQIKNAASSCLPIGYLCGAGRKHTLYVYQRWEWEYAHGNKCSSCCVSGPRMLVELHNKLTHRGDDHHFDEEDIRTYFNEYAPRGPPEQPIPHALAALPELSALMARAQMSRGGDDDFGDDGNTYSRNCLFTFDRCLIAADLYEFASMATFGSLEIYCQILGHPPVSLVRFDYGEHEGFRGPDHVASEIQFSELMAVLELRETLPSDLIAMLMAHADIPALAADRDVLGKPCPSADGDAVCCAGGEACDLDKYDKYVTHLCSPMPLLASAFNRVLCNSPVLGELSSSYGGHGYNIAVRE